MLQVTEEARAHAAYELGRAGVAEDVVFRLGAHEGGLVLQHGRVEPDDVVFDHDGRAVIALPKDLASELGAVVLQVEQTESGARLQLRERG